MFRLSLRQAKLHKLTPSILAYRTSRLHRQSYSNLCIHFNIIQESAARDYYFCFRSQSFLSTTEKLQPHQLPAEKSALCEHFPQLRTHRFFRLSWTVCALQLWQVRIGSGWVGKGDKLVTTFAVAISRSWLDDVTSGSRDERAALLAEYVAISSEGWYDIFRWMLKESSCGELDEYGSRVDILEDLSGDGTV